MSKNFHKLGMTVVALVFALALTGCGTQRAIHRELERKIQASDPETTSGTTSSGGSSSGSKNSGTASSGTTSSGPTASSDALYNSETDGPERMNDNPADGVGYEAKPYSPDGGNASDKYKEKMMQGPDDAYDFMWASDYNESTILKFRYIRDSGGYKATFGFDKPTKQQLFAKIDANREIDPKYTELLKEYVDKWLTLWPESDLSVLYYNLETLKLQEMTEREIQKAAMSIGTVACYIPKDNLICINKDTNPFDRSSDDYVVFMHELTHAARGCSVSKHNGNVELSIKFFEDINYGLYSDEALDTYFVYELQGLGHRSKYYIYQSSILRQLMPGIDYDGADYMNHQVFYFVTKLQERLDELGDPIPAYHYLDLFEDQGTRHYREFAKADYEEFSELFDLEVRNYIDLHVTPDMTYAQTEEAFETFYEDITFNLEKLSRPYEEVTREAYRVFWDREIEKLGIYE